LIKFTKEGITKSDAAGDKCMCNPSQYLILLTEWSTLQSEETSCNCGTYRSITMRTLGYKAMLTASQIPVFPGNIMAPSSTVKML
jgi:hypothetical protein